jgi:hypothetical protein
VAPTPGRPRDNINWWPLYIAIVAGTVLGGWFLWSRNLLYLAVLLAPVFAWAVARMIINSAGTVWFWKRKAEWQEWEGINYAYGPQHLRALEFEDALWFYEKDLLIACGQKNDGLARMLPASERRLLEGTKLHVLSEAGCEHLLMKIHGTEAKKLLMYLRREAYFPFKRARGQQVDVPTMR